MVGRLPSWRLLGHQLVGHRFAGQDLFGQDLFGQDLFGHDVVDPDGDCDRSHGLRWIGRHDQRGRGLVALDVEFCAVDAVRVHGNPSVRGALEFGGQFCSGGAEFRLQREHHFLRGWATRVGFGDV